MYNNNGTVKTRLFLVVAVVVAIAIVLGCYKFINTYIISQTSGNIFYTSTLNYSLPVISNKNKEVKDEYDLDFRLMLLEALGINIYNPLSVIQKEIPFLYGNITEEDERSRHEAELAITPFKLSEGSLTKNGDGAQENKENIKPIENKEVGKVTNEDLKKSLDKAKPEVLIYHTHNSESYGKDAFSIDYDKTVVAIGNEISKNLELNYGISTLHDKTIHDSWYNSAYSKSRQTLDTYLKKYGNFKIILDVHRDAGASRNATLTKMNGEDVATVRFVVTQKSPNLKENMKIVNEIMNTSKKLYPSFMHDIYDKYNVGQQYFGQDKSPAALLIEVGSNKNDFNDAKNSAKYIARLLAEYINKK